MGKTVAIVQSSYIPWQGYFELIVRSDTFIFLDSVQFTRRDWRTRNYINSSGGLQRLSVPVRAKNHMHYSVYEIEINRDSNWNRKHLAAITQSYSSTPYGLELVDLITPTYQNPPKYLNQLNRILIKTLWNYASGGLSRNFIGDEKILNSSGHDSNMRLIEICQRVGADRYLSGPSAKRYIDLVLWGQHGISVEFIDYSITHYHQNRQNFEPFISILDPISILGNSCIANLFKDSLIISK